MTSLASVPSCLSMAALPHLTLQVLAWRRLNSPAEQPQARAPGLPAETVASLTAALQQYETASAHARAAAGSAVDRQIDVAKAALSDSSTVAEPEAARSDRASEAADSDAAPIDTEAQQQELLTQRQSVDAMLGEVLALVGKS